MRYAGNIESGVQVFDVKRGESPGMRYLHFNRWLRAEMGPVHLIVYEQTHQRGGAATEVAAGFATRVQEYCAESRTEHTAVHTATLKKWATAKGNCGKLAMIERAVQLSDDFAARYGEWTRERKATAKEVEAAWADEADALLLLAYALETLAEGLQTAERTETT